MQRGEEREREREEQSEIFEGVEGCEAGVCVCVCAVAYSFVGNTCDG